VLLAIGNGEVDYGLSQHFYSLKDAEAAAFAVTGAVAGEANIRIWALDISRTMVQLGNVFTLQPSSLVRTPTWRVIAAKYELQPPVLVSLGKNYR
jgi:hypothetical protein